MAIRIRELYIITVRHGQTNNVIELPPGTTAEEAAYRLQKLAKDHEALVKGSVIVDVGKPVYRFWKMWGSTHREDTEPVL